MPNWLHRLHNIICNSSLILVAVGAASFSASLPSPAVAQANVTISEICIRVPDRSEAGTDDGGLTVTLVGDKATSAPFKLDNRAGDQLNRGTWSCFKHDLGDLGFIQRMYLNMKSNDDICYMQQYVRTYTYGKETSISQFPGNGCLGDDAPSRTVWLNTSTKPPSKLVRAGKARGIWVVGCSGGQNCKTQLTKSMTIDNSKEASWSREVQNAVSVSIEAGVEMGAASASTSTTVSHQNTRGSAGAIASSVSKGFEQTCEQDTNFTDFNVSVVYQWQVEVPVQGKTVRIKTCQIACRSSTGPEPQHGPLHPVSLDSCKQTAAVAPTAQAAPRFLGCFSDAPSRDLNGYNVVGPTMTGAECAGICGQRGFQFAGTQYTNQCFCGNSYGKHGSTNPCNMPCAGNPNETCGGAYANSVYQVK